MSLDVHELRSREEAEAVLRVNGAAWRAGYGFLPESSLPDPNYRPDPDRVLEFYRNVQERSAPVLVASEEGGVRGFVELRWAPDETEPFVPVSDAELKALYVDPDAWDRGIGTRLVSEAHAAVPDRFDRLTLQTFRENQRARSFYERRGFERVGESSFDLDGVEYPTVVYARPVE